MHKFQALGSTCFFGCRDLARRIWRLRLKTFIVKCFVQGHAFGLQAFAVHMPGSDAQNALPVLILKSILLGMKQELLKLQDHVEIDFASLVAVLNKEELIRLCREPRSAVQSLKKTNSELALASVLSRMNLSPSPEGLLPMAKTLQAHTSLSWSSPEAAVAILGRSLRSLVHSFCL